MNLKYFIILLSILYTPLQASRILSIFAVPLATQYAFIEPLLKELAIRGHHITSITNYPQKEPLENFRDIVVEENKHLFDGFQNFTMETIADNYYEIIHSLYNEAFQMCLNVLNNPTVRKMLDTEKFDLIILEIFFTESLFGLSEYLQAPIVGVSNWGAVTGVDEVVGNISPISYIPNLILPFKEMNFWQRLLNSLVHTMEWVHYYYKYMPVQEQIYDIYFPKAQKSFWQSQKDFSLVLLNDHYSLTAPRPYVPNMIEVAGLHIDTNPKSIPDSVNEILDNANQGVIFVTIDSTIPSHAVDIFLKIFSSLKEIILWKTFQEIDNLPANIYVNSTYSTSSILTHPNVKLFIAEGTFLAITESVYHGLPILCFGPTKNTDGYADHAKKVGNGFTIRLDNISEHSLSKALKDILSSSTYSNLAKVLSKRFRDQQTTPMERAVYWIEYVLRHNGATHLRNMGQNLTWYEFYNIDILIFLFLIISLVILLAYVIIQIVMNLFVKLKFKRYDPKNKEH